MSENAGNTSKFENKQEVEKFSQYAQDWWNPNGDMKPLHHMNPARVGYIKDILCKYFAKDNTSEKPLKGLNILDVGCGGGLLSESLALLGANVTGIDASKEMIEIAKTHAKITGVKIEYQHTSIEDIAETGKQFDVVTCLEVLEHVDNTEEFVNVCGKCVKDNGIFAMSTINRTIKSYALAIIGAEYILRWLPVGTHKWDKFLKPSEVCQKARLAGLKTYDMVGMHLNPITNIWRFDSKDLDVNYILHFKK